MSVCVYDECEYNIWFWLHMLLHLSAASETLSLLFFFGGGGAWVLVFGASPCPLIISAVILVTTVTDWLKFM